jgi:RNA polymerase sigma-70 factor (ECF subfamily)
VRAVRDPGGPAASALEILYRRCWPALCRALRRSGTTAADAEDLAQHFFLNVIARRSLRHARLQSGCFRPFLLAAARHLALNERARSRAQKRGGRFAIGPLKEECLVCRGSATARAPETPEQFAERRALERAWTEVRSALLDEARDAAARQRVEALLSHVEGWGGGRLADELATSEGAARVALHRLRRRVAARLAGRDFAADREVPTLAGWLPPTAPRSGSSSGRPGSPRP